LYSCPRVAQSALNVKYSSEFISTRSKSIFINKCQLRTRQVPVLCLTKLKLILTLRFTLGENPNVVLRQQPRQKDEATVLLVKGKPCYINVALGDGEFVARFPHARAV